jgi:hypothetical protein
VTRLSVGGRPMLGRGERPSRSEKRNRDQEHRAPRSRTAPAPRRLEN